LPHVNQSRLSKKYYICDAACIKNAACRDEARVNQIV
jgi:hypothetical protein